MNQTNTKHLYELDFVRCIAILLVVFFHFGLYLDFIPGYFTIVRAGSMGVQLFFILSSFLLSQQFVKSQLKNIAFPSIKDYVLKRILRIVPLFLLSSLVLFFIRFREVDTSFSSIIHYVFFLEDLRINPVVWSLFIEMRFYLALPLIFLLIKKMDNPWATRILILILLLSSYATRYLIYQGIDVGSIAGLWGTMFLENLDCFMLGIIAAYANEYYKSKVFWKIPLLATLVLLLAMVYCSLSYYPTDNRIIKQVFLYPIFNISWVAIIFVLLQLKKFEMTGVINKPIFIYLSTLSYGIYIWHLSIRHYMLAFAEYFTVIESPLFYLSQFILSWLVTLVISHFVYYYFELPIMNSRKKLLKLF